MSIGHVALRIIVRILAADHKLQFKVCNYYQGLASSPMIY